MHTLSDMQKGHIGHLFGSGSGGDFMIFQIEAQVQMAGGALHSVHQSIGIKQGSAALSPETGGAHLYAGNDALLRDQPGNDAFDRKGGRARISFTGPFDIILLIIIGEVIKLRKWKSQATEHPAGTGQGIVGNEFREALVIDL